MEKKDYTQYALCQFSEVDAVSIMPGIARKSISLFLELMGIEIDQNVPLSVSFTAFMDEFLDNGEWLLKIVPSVYLDFLLEIWGKMDRARRHQESFAQIYIDENDWQIVAYLSTFGLLGYQRIGVGTEQPSRIYVVKEVMDAFYFQLRSRKTKAIIEKYSLWEALIQGYMKLVGIAALSQMQEMLQDITEKEIVTLDLLEFIRCRTTFWGVGKMHYDEKENTYYYISNMVEDPMTLFQLLEKCDILKYKHYTQKELFAMHESQGGYQKWPGVKALAAYLMDEMEMDYYRATVLLSKSIYHIQNGHSYEDLMGHFDLVTHDQLEKPRELIEILKVFYENVPVFALKGYSHKEYHAFLQQKEKEKKRGSFKFIK